MTEAGQRLFAEVSPLLEGISEATSGVAGASAMVSGRLRVNCDPWFAGLLLAPRLQGFLDAHPALTLELLVRDTLGDLVSDGFDAAIRFGEPQGLGIAQPLAIGINDLLRDGRLVELFPDWNGERFPLYVYHPTCRLRPAKLRAFLDFIVTDVTLGSRG